MPADLTDRVVTTSSAVPRLAATWRLHVIASPDANWRGAIVRLSAGGPFADGVQIGRLPDATSALRIDDSTLSRRHATITPASGSHSSGSRSASELLRVTDLGSSNGTFVGGQRIQEAFVSHGAVIRFGANVLVLERDTGTCEAAAEPTVDLPGRSERVRQLRGALEDAAQDGLPVLLHGETGTGKEHAAHELHVRSGRKGKLVRVNAAAIPESLFEAELFGHVAGAFTGALAARPGRVREAQNGTLVLDEIGELAPNLQAKLLRLLEERSVRAVGAAKDEPIDVRFCASTNADLPARVKEGRFRRDLLARFHTHMIALPALRERRMDLFALADVLLPLRSPTGATSSWPTALHEETVEALLLYDWPDNLREFAATLVHLRRHVGEQPVPRSVLSSTILRHTGVLPSETSTAPQLASRKTGQMPVVSDLPPPIPEPSLPDAPSAAALRQALLEERGVLENVARRFGRHRKQVYRWLEQAGIDEAELKRYREG
jgi:DNA-binding NtrC family response regulator